MDLTRVRLQEQFDRLDADIAQWCADYAASGRRLHCRKGCAACCTLHVRASGVEALAIAARLDAVVKERLAGYVQRLRIEADAADSLLDFLRRQRREVGACPFLDGAGECAVYPVRPLACRALLATRPADWCGVDFSSLHPLETAAFRDSLDRSVVAWPTHYAAATRDAAQQLEERLCAEMRRAWGFAATGSLGYLVWLLHPLAGRDPVEWRETLAAEAAARPYLLDIS